MTKQSRDIVVVAAFDNTYIDSCLESLGDRYQVVVMDTSSGGHPSGAYVRAYREHPADNYLFIQDSMRAITDDVMAPFREKMPELGAVAWGHFGLFFDTQEQAEWVDSQYSCPMPEYGIFGPVFYTNRASMELLDSKGLFPKTPENKLQAQGTERAWAFAFKQADLPVESLGFWDKGRMERGEHQPFSKVWGGRA